MSCKQGTASRSQGKKADGSRVDMRSPEFFGYGPEIKSRSQDREADDSRDDTISPEFFRYGLEIISRSSTDREFDDAANDTEVRNFEIQAGDHKQNC